MEEKVLNILGRVCGTDEVKDNMDANLFDMGFLDSLAVIELFLAIEEELNISIEPIEVQREEICTPRLLVDYIKKRN